MLLAWKFKFDVEPRTVHTLKGLHLKRITYLKCPSLPWFIYLHMCQFELSIFQREQILLHWIRLGSNRDSKVVKLHSNLTTSCKKVKEQLVARKRWYLKFYVKTCLQQGGHNNEKRYFFCGVLTCGGYFYKYEEIGSRRERLHWYKWCKSCNWTPGQFL